MKNYNLKLAIRNLMRQRMGSFINILGLSVSFAVCVLITLYVQYEFSFENHNEDSENIYRLIEGEKKYVSQPIMFFKPLTENIPELAKATLVFKIPSQFFMIENEKRIVSEVIFTNANFLSFFKMKLLEGNSNQPLDAPNAGLLSKSEADKLFPKGDAVGKIIKYNNHYNVEIKGVFEDAPVTANYRPNVILNVESIKTLDEYQYTHKGYSSSVFFFKLSDNPDLELIKSKIVAQGKVVFEDKDFDSKYHFQALKDIHLYSADTTWDAIKRSDIKMVNTFIIIAFLILMIATFNFINLSLSLSSKRNFNTGIQKVLGADKKSIFAYFLIETSIVMIVCIAIALVLASILVPVFNQFMDIQLSFSFDNPMLWITVFAIAFLNVLLPSIIQAQNKLKINPVNAIKSKGKTVSKNVKHGYSFASQALTITQITITIVLIAGVFAINKQFDLLLNKKLGFDKANLVTVVNPWEQGKTHLSEKRHRLYKKELEKSPFVESVTGTFNSPGKALNNGDYLLKMGRDSSDLFVMRSPVDLDYFKTMKTKFLLGEAPLVTDSSKLVINETCWKKLGVDNPIGMTVERKFGGGQQYQICGVIEDIQNQSLKEENQAAVYYLDDFLFTFIIRLAPGDLRQSLAQLEVIWNKVEPNHPFQYSFVDEDLHANYAKEIQTEKLLRAMSLLAIVLSMLGLFAMSLQVIERRTKEIGIRKINGATITEILRMLNKGFVKWVAIAFVIATPIAYYAMNKWLENFAYKTALSWWIFALAGLSALVIALLTVSWQSYRAASRNPVEALRYE